MSVIYIYTYIYISDVLEPNIDVVLSNLSKGRFLADTVSFFYTRLDKFECLLTKNQKEDKNNLAIYHKFIKTDDLACGFHEIKDVGPTTINPTTINNDGERRGNIFDNLFMESLIKFKGTEKEFQSRRNLSCTISRHILKNLLEVKKITSTRTDISSFTFYWQIVWGWFKKSKEKNH